MNIGCVRDLRALCLIILLMVCGRTAAELPIAVIYGSPLRITKGGTYSGNWQSLDPAIPAVWVQTPDPVTIENCNIASMGDAIQAYNTHANLTVRNCRASALNPNSTGKLKGHFVVTSFFDSVVVEHNRIDGFSSAVFGSNYPAETADTFHGQRFLVRYNAIFNIDTRLSDGHGGYIGDPTFFVNSGVGTYFLRDAIIEVSWNEIINIPYMMGSEGDVVSTAESRGQTGLPILIHDNYIQGGYPSDPAAHVHSAACMVQIGDAPDKGDVGYVHVYDNQIVNFDDGCGVEVSSGHNNEIDHNRVISAATTPEGALLWSDWRTGLAMYDYWSDTQNTLKPTGNPFWHDNSMHDNAVNVVRDGWVTQSYFGIVEATVTQTNNYDPFGRPATSADERAEFANWQQKLLSNSISLGPTIAGVGENYEGLWWASPAGSESGWGINFAHQGDVIFATWFTYDLTGKEWWLSMTANKNPDGSFAGTLYQTHGPAFNAMPFNPAAITVAAVGTGTLAFADASNGTFAYTVNGVTQTKAITREVFGARPTCTFGTQSNLALATNYQDLWWAAPAGSESGWGINLTQEGNVIFGTWFTYDLDGTPLWLSVTANSSAPGVFSGTLYRTTGPAFNAVPFLPVDVKPTAVGTATFTFADGNNATFTYSFNGTSQSKAITREVFRAPGTVCQ